MRLREGARARVRVRVLVCARVCVCVRVCRMYVLIKYLKWFMSPKRMEPAASDGAEWSREALWGGVAARPPTASLGAPTPPPRLDPRDRLRKRPKWGLGGLAARGGVRTDTGMRRT